MENKEHIIIRARKRKQEILKEHPEYEGKIMTCPNNEIYCTSNKDVGIYLKLEEIKE